MGPAARAPVWTGQSHSGEGNRTGGDRPHKQNTQPKQRRAPPTNQARAARESTHKIQRQPTRAHLGGKSTAPGPVSEQIRTRRPERFLDSATNVGRVRTRRQGKTWKSAVIQKATPALARRAQPPKVESGAKTKTTSETSKPQRRPRKSRIYLALAAAVSPGAPECCKYA